MKKLIVSALLLGALFPLSAVKAQYESIVHQGEFGISAGAAHYFGDLNTRAKINRPKPAIGVFFRKQFGNYISARITAHYAQVGYSDVYNTDNVYQKRRNLSFNSRIFELALMGDFNFFKFIPADPYYRFTPYVTIGVGIFNYDPYAYLGDRKVFLRPLRTEGQESDAYPSRKVYSTMAMCIPIGVGVKYALNERMNVGFEVVHRFAGTDYLDDVSTTYAGAAAFDKLPNDLQSDALLLQDRSYETGTPIGVKDRQRGFAKQKDQYIMAELTFSINFSSYRCPTAN